MSNKQTSDELKKELTEFFRALDHRSDTYGREFYPKKVAEAIENLIKAYIDPTKFSEESREKEKQAALDKLTPHELILLGLKKEVL